MRRPLAATTNAYTGTVTVYCDDGSAWEHRPGMWPESERWVQLFPSLPDTEAAGLDHTTEKTQATIREQGWKHLAEKAKERSDNDAATA
jgi:hypothetical protein